ncbi:hypothetical protein OTSGILL_1778 [Orientia tsutsugamushi str. Gilliam]|uniref:Uncharacterized protein n=1 Tax=Orientia tsutsugamushi str. Gilliam TaxID=1359184 RepID=A0A0F3M8M1_ORITS|nr:hypothetical protein OTSGILL_1778 [Orientia tsutsugamushi str. Gilliam]KJV57590.1 hypothetical protein OTSKARP_0034 [Orientia tsutsugamushi str. Karp]
MTNAKMLGTNIVTGYIGKFLQQVKMIYKYYKK